MNLLDTLDPEQREVALATRGAVCVLAGAGTGKTRAITHRIAYAVATGAMDPAHVLALTFTVRAAGELRGRLRQLGAGRVRASTFHAAALRQLNYFWPRVVGGRPPRLVDSKVTLIREAARAAKVRVTAAADVAAEIEWAKTLQIRPHDYENAAAMAGRQPTDITTADQAAIYAAYEQLRRERHLIDFESVLELTAAIVFEHRIAADQVRDMFRYFVVDEFQDVSPLQKLLLDAWLGDRDDICVVGDPHQTIYTFAGATSSYLTGFSKEFPKAVMVRLVRDYRSTPQVVAVANQLSRASAPLVAQRKPGPSPMLTEFGDEVDEADGVAIQIRALLAGGVPAREIAILVRINAHTERFESALAGARVPYVVRGAERFYDRPVVKQALVLMRGAARSAHVGQAHAGQAHVGQPHVSQVHAGQAHAGHADAGQGAQTLPEAVRHILTSMGFTALAPAGGGAEARERWESLAAIAQLAEDTHAERPAATLADFAADLTQRAELGHAPVVDGVTITTMHAAKGLEWDAVLLPGLVEGIMPIVYARTPETIDEERRLLYVAVTRAREHLYLSWAPARAPGSRPTRERSQFLKGLRLGGRYG